MATTYTQLLNCVITDGVAAARVDYASDPDGKLRGAIEGFEACRDKTAAEIVNLHRNAERAAREHHGAGDYWRYRCAALEMEWVLNVLSAGLAQLDQDPLLPHLPTARGVLKYAQIVGVRGESAATRGGPVS